MFIEAASVLTRLSAGAVLSGAIKTKPSAPQNNRFNLDPWMDQGSENACLESGVGFGT